MKPFWMTLTISMVTISDMGIKVEFSNIYRQNVMKAISSGLSLSVGFYITFYMEEILSILLP
jgi:hypothetical protein